MNTQQLQAAYEKALAGWENNLRKVSQLETTIGDLRDEISRLNAHESVENVRLVARVAELEVESSNARTESDVLQRRGDRLEAERDTARAEVESLRAQLAEAQAKTERVADWGTRTNQAALKFEARAESAEEQLRVAREALEKLDRFGRYSGANDKSTLMRWIREVTEPVLAALSASAPKAEPTDTYPGCTCSLKHCECYEKWLAKPSQATPVCDDVTLMKVAEAVYRNALGEFFPPGSELGDADREHLAAIVKGVRP